MNPKKKMAPVHPGEILLEEFMKPLELSQTRLGRDLGVSPRRINEIVHGKRSITADTALRLSRYFGTSAEFWVGLQADYDLEVATDRLADRIAREVKVFFPMPEPTGLKSTKWCQTPFIQLCGCRGYASFFCLLMISTSDLNA